MQLHNQDSFNISNDPVTDGSAVSYTITYSNSMTNYPSKISASSCVNKSCSHTFAGSELNCPSDNINVAVVATNVLGNGRSSATIERGTYMHAHPTHGIDQTILYQCAN